MTFASLNRVNSLNSSYRSGLSSNKSLNNVINSAFLMASRLYSWMTFNSSSHTILFLSLDLKDAKKSDSSLRFRRFPLLCDTQWVFTCMYVKERGKEESECVCDCYEISAKPGLFMYATFGGVIVFACSASWWDSGRNCSNPASKSGWSANNSATSS